MSAPESAAERRPFEAEVSRLLEIVAHSLYSDRRVFLRELVSNGADACDRLRYEALQRPELLAGDSQLRITLRADPSSGTLTVADNGVGMDRDDLVANLGTIARSGTAAFAGGLGGDAKADATTMIGQFGVGFYSSFMVADRVDVVSRRAGKDEAWHWSSDGKGSFTIGPALKAGRGTDVTLHLKPDAREFLDANALRAIVRDYADHIAVPVVLAGEREETLNQASALWTRQRTEITEAQYAEFYRHLARRWDSPFAAVHWKAEGVLEYTGLLFVPGEASFDIWSPEKRHGVKLYVRRVFITDRADELVPRWLRFLVGVVDSSDLPLNVSREMLQNNPIVRKIGQGIVAKVVGELERQSRGAERYAKFWEAFGPVLKEGLVQDPEHREKLLNLCRFRSSTREGWIGLADYVGRMKGGQQAIYYVAGDDPKALRMLPQLEGYAKRGVEVLLLSDAVDDFWLQHVHDFHDKPFRSVTRGVDDLARITAPEGPAEPAPVPTGEFDGLVAFLRVTLDADVKDVRLSQRLEGSAACLVADDRDLDIHLERLLRQHRQLETVAKRILEINPRHALVRAMADALRASGGHEKVAEAARLLVDQARLVAGDPLPDPVGFARRLEAALQRGLPGH